MSESKSTALLQSCAKLSGDNIERDTRVILEGGYFKSPIEELFFLGLMCAIQTPMGMYMGVELFLSKGDSPWATSSGLISPSTNHALRQGLPFGYRTGDEFTIKIYPQCMVGPYCADFFVEYVHAGFDDSAVRLVVECDGHDFHERTKEQAKKDRARDRFMQKVGLPVLRYTGSEIFANAADCGKQVLDFIEATGDRVLHGC